MKNIYMVRHAKSSWEDMSLRDADRPLNNRGKRDAPFMAKLIAGKVSRPDAFLSSPAKRAFTTAKYFAEAWGRDKKDIILKPSIYEAYHSDILALIQHLDADWQTVFIFGHNPTFTNFVNLFPGGKNIANVPTCGVIALESTADTWTDVSPQNTRIVHFYYPKQYLS